MAIKDLPSPEVLRQLLRYDPETGTLYWLPRAASFFNSERASKVWNSRYAGKPALNNIRSGLRHGSLLNISVTAHRVVWCLATGKWPDGDIDHINRDASDNRMENLRDVPHAVNMKNMGVRKDNTSGITGVRQASKNGWAAQISDNGKMRYLGCFNTIEAAVAARAKAAAELGYHPTHGVSSRL